jgi:TPR repeat protein
MRTSSIVLVGLAIAGLASGLGPSMSLDGTPSAPADAAIPTSPLEAFQAGAEALRLGEKARAVSALQYAAEHGQGFALWQLGRMYADGNGVPRDDYRAFEYFRKFADSHADDSPAIPRSRFVANAFVQLGQYYRHGIPNSSVRPSPELAHKMFHHAAAFFGDAEAQYQLAMLYIDGVGVQRDPRRAVPWLLLAARKGHYKSQAVLGRILFRGEHVPRQPGGSVPWIAELRQSAIAQATEQERAAALALLERWVEGRRDY